MIEILKKKQFPLEVVGSVCCATKERQEAVRKLAAQCNTVFILGSATSSNTARLQEIAQGAGAKTYRLESADFLTEDMLPEHGDVGIASGASAPDELVDALYDKISKFLQSQKRGN